MTRTRIAAVSLSWLMVVPAACTPRESADPSDSAVEPSPNASILPAPLNSGTHPRPRTHAHTDGGVSVTGAEGGITAPVALRDDQPLPAEEPQSKDVLGLELEAEFRWPDLPHPLTVPDAPPDTVRRVRQLVALTLRIDVAHYGRLRVRFVGHGFAVASQSELRSRADHYGSILVWPGESSYRILVPGMLRALLEEGRADMTPLVQAKVTRLSEERLLDQKTERVQLDTATGKLTLSQAQIPTAGSGGELLCRLLLELDGAEPDSEVCVADSLPVAADYEWSEGGRLLFEVTDLNKRQELALDALSVPPLGASFRVGELPARPNEPILDSATLSQLHGHPGRPAEPPGAAQNGAKSLGVTNHTDTGRYLLLDGVPVIWLPGHSDASLIGVKPGRYTVSWRDFGATQISPPAVATLPSHLVIGSDGDAGKGL